MLLQGLSLPSPSPCSSSTTPPALSRPSLEPQPQTNPHPAIHSEDTRGRATIGRGPRMVGPSPLLQRCVTASVLDSTAGSSTSADDEHDPVTVEVETTPTAVATVARTTDWRRRKAAAQGKDMALPRKVYTCKVCQQTMTSSGHTQYKGQRYCPNAPGQVPVGQWLAERRRRVPNTGAKAAKN